MLDPACGMNQLLRIAGQPVGYNVAVGKTNRLNFGAKVPVNQRRLATVMKTLQAKI